MTASLRGKEELPDPCTDKQKQELKFEGARVSKRDGWLPWQDIVSRFSPHERRGRLVNRSGLAGERST